MSDGIRGLMSQKKKELAGESNLSGKDKVALLKRMREKQKLEASLEEKRPQKIQKAVEKSAHLPNNFYDEVNGNEHTRQVNAVQAPSKSSQPIPTSNSSISLVDSAPKAGTNSSSLPKGFFDNPFEDSKARGVNLMKVLEEKDKQMNSQLKSFLSEINETNELQEEADANEDNLREEENEAVQMSYLVRYAGLLTKASKLSKADNLVAESTPKLFEEGNELTNLLSVVESEESANPQNSESAVENIEDILRAKRKEAKRLKKIDESKEYIPLDSSDWMTRYI